MNKLLPGLMTIWLLLVSMSPDGGELYDGLFSRPTHYPEWQHPTQWPNNMTYFVRVQNAATQQMITNYEVAVYDENGQLRHCSRSVAKYDDLCTLTISGEDGEQFHFQVISGDFDNPEVYKAKETITFLTNDVVGSLAEPFMLTATKDASAIGLINVDPSTDNTIYNLMGQKVSGNHRGIAIKNGKKIVVK